MFTLPSLLILKTRESGQLSLDKQMHSNKAVFAVLYVCLWNRNNS